MKWRTRELLEEMFDNGLSLPLLWDVIESQNFVLLVLLFFPPACSEDIVLVCSGLLAIMDEQAIMPRATDGTMVEKFHQCYGNHPAYEKPRSNDPIFTIRHYAGSVEYQSAGFLEKNRDTLALDVLAALRLR